MGKHIEIEPGTKFNKLTFIKELDERNERGQIMCLCKCECGTIKPVIKALLTCGHIKSCGCSWKDAAKRRGESQRIGNKYCRKHKSYDIGYFNNADDKFFIDKEDYDLVSKYTWQKTKKGYARATIYDSDNGNRPQKLMHRLIYDTHNANKKYKILDHINGDKLDNRKNNIRAVTESQSMMNQGASIKNTSGKRGVYYHKKTNKWVATITVDRKRDVLGYFDNLEDAIKIREAAEIRVFGEYRRKQ